MKICAKCKDTKDDECFAYKLEARGWRQPYCRPCQKKYRHEHYILNREKCILKAKDWTVSRRQQVYEYLRGARCLDCGNDNPVVLTFDHLRDKEFNIGQKRAAVSWDRLMLEIQKCDIVCANCHAIRTASRSNWYSYVDHGALA